MRTTCRLRSWPRVPSPHHRRLPERLHARRRAGRARRRRDRAASSTRWPPPATTTSSSPPAIGIPPDHSSFAAQGGPWPVHCVAGTQGAQLHADARPHRGSTSIVDKGQAVDTDGYSGFEGTDLEELLRERGITQVTVVGLATDYCVKNTALDALRAGFAGHRRHQRRARRRGRARRLRARAGRGARGRRRDGVRRRLAARGRG